MSYDPNAGVAMGNMEQRPSSGKKWWMLGGCGCFTLLLLCCGGGFGVFYSFVQPMMQLINETTATVRSSDVVGETLGTPIELSAAPTKQTQESTPEGMPIIVYEYSIKGSKAEGTLVFKLEFQQDYSWKRSALYIELEDGTKVDLDPTEMIPDLDIDEGDLDGDEMQLE